MGKKRGLTLAFLFVALTGGLVWMISRQAEPAYQGKPLSAWLAEFNGGPGDTNQAAFVAFRELGTNAIPALLRIIESKDPPFQRLILALNRMQSLVHFPAREPWSLKWAASCALYALGTNAKPAFPALTNLLLRTNAAIYSAISLAGMGSEVVPPLIAALTNQSPFIRSRAAFGLSWERSDLNIVVPALIARLSDPDRNVRLSAVSALGQLHAEPGLAVPALMKDYPGSDPLLRRLILTSIGRFETNAKVAVPMLLEALSDNDQNVPRHAASALKRIDPEAATKAGVK